MRDQWMDSDTVRIIAGLLQGRARKFKGMDGEAAVLKVAETLMLADRDALETEKKI